MDFVSASSSLSSSFLQSFPGSLQPNSLFRSQNFSLKSQVSIPSRSQHSLLSLVSTSATSSRNLNFGQETRNPNLTFQLCSPQLSASRMPASQSDPMSLLLRERIVFVGNEITDFVADAICTQLLLLDATDSTKDIKLFINSPGGSLSAALAIFDVVQLVRADVSTIAFGVAASTAAIVLGGGTKGKRFSMPNARIMMHQPVAGASGNVGDLINVAEEVMKTKKNLVRIISEFSGRSPEQIEEDIEWDHYLSPMEALEYGVIDGIIDRDLIVPLVPNPEMLKPMLDSGI